MDGEGKLSAVKDYHLDTQADGTSPKSNTVQPKIRNASIPRGPACGTAPSPPVEQAQRRGDAAQVEEQEWEIIKILDTRETVSGTEYKVRWKSTWLPKGELRNARKSLREFEAKRQAQWGGKRGRPARVDKGR